MSNAPKVVEIGQQLSANIPFSAATRVTVAFTSSKGKLGIQGTNYRILVTPVRATAGVSPAWHIENKVSGQFDIVTDAAFTGSFDVLISG